MEIIFIILMIGVFIAFIKENKERKNYDEEQEDKKARKKIRKWKTSEIIKSDKDIEWKILCLSKQSIENPKELKKMLYNKKSLEDDVAKCLVLRHEILQLNNKHSKLLQEERNGRYWLNALSETQRIQAANDRYAEFDRRNPRSTNDDKQLIYYKDVIDRLEYINNDKIPGIKSDLHEKKWQTNDLQRKIDTNVQNILREFGLKATRLPMMLYDL